MTSLKAPANETSFPLIVRARKLCGILAFALMVFHSTGVAQSAWSHPLPARAVPGSWGGSGSVVPVAAVLMQLE